MEKSESWVACLDMERISSPLFASTAHHQFSITEGQLLSFSHKVPLGKSSQCLNGFSLCTVATHLIWWTVFCNCPTKTKCRTILELDTICHRFKKRFPGNLQAMLLRNDSDSISERLWDQCYQTKLVK